METQLTSQKSRDSKEYCQATYSQTISETPLLIISRWKCEKDYLWTKTAIFSCQSQGYPSKQRVVPSESFSRPKLAFFCHHQPVLSVYEFFFCKSHQNKILTFLFQQPQNTFFSFGKFELILTERKPFPASFLKKQKSRMRTEIVLQIG